MSRLAALDLDSFRLVQYAHQHPCFVCEGPVAYDSDRCRHCFAPLALTPHAVNSKVRARMIAFLGAPEAGKSVYLGMLMDMLSRQVSGPQAVARGPHSISLTQHVVSALAQCQFPQPTAATPETWDWVHCQIVLPENRRPCEVIAPDMSGSAVLEEIDHPHTHAAVNAMLCRCEGAVVLIDTPALEAGDHQQEYVAMKLLSALDTAADGLNEKKVDRPLAIVFNKVDDGFGPLENPEAYARRHAAGLWRQCKETFPKHHYFACGIVGATAVTGGWDRTARIPLRIEPQGVLEPFAWLVRSLGK